MNTTAAPSIEFYLATGFFQRLFGLLARPALQPGEALVLQPCSSVHTCFMAYAIDVVFVDQDERIAKVCADIKPWRAAACWGAHAAIELVAGEAMRRGLQPGQTLRWKPVPGDAIVERDTVHPTTL